MSKKISVVMPTYNGEKYIEEQLMSILNQTVKPNEIIVSDDGSKDNTLTVVERWHIKRLFRWLKWENKKRNC